MNVINFDIPNKVRKFKHNSTLPNDIRCIICGPAGCGKTNLILNFLCWLKYDRLYVYSKTLFQPKYEMLKRIFEEIEHEEKGTIAHFYTNNADVVPPDELEQCNAVFVFDDVLLDPQRNIEKYFAQGRHSNVDCFYLSQTYSRIPKQIIRDNANLMVLFRQDDKNLKHVYDNHVGTDMTFDEFRRLCKRCWDDNYSFLTIDKTKTRTKGRYKKTFKDIL